MVYIALIVAAGLVGVDQLFKWLAIQKLEPIDTYSVLMIGDKEVLNFTYTENSGAAFGILSNQRYLLLIITIAAMIAAIYLLASKKINHNFLIWSVSLIIAGGLGNLIDRIFRAYVVDYIDVRLINFAIFNFADCCVVIGTIGLLIYVIFLDGRTQKDKALDTGDAGNIPEEEDGLDMSIDSSASLDVDDILAQYSRSKDEGNE
ncbi:MAG: signal peptidase II [Clostridiales bacterium]|nr:signal peptidase II [Clostridiales bacterium]